MLISNSTIFTCVLLCRFQPNTPLTDTSSNRSSSASATPAKVSPAHSPSQLTPSSTPPTTRHIQQLQPIKQQQQQQAPPARPAPSPVITQEGEEDQTTLGNRFSKWFAPSESKVQQGTRVEDEKSAGRSGAICPQCSIFYRVRS